MVSTYEQQISGAKGKWFSPSEAASFEAGLSRLNSTFIPNHYWVNRKGKRVTVADSTA